MDTPVSNKPTLQRLSDQSVHVLEDTTIIGRHEDCNLVLKSERGASRKHARITVENNAAVLMDLGSLNGTTVNGREISRVVQLSDGDIVVFDEQEYRFAGPAALPNASGDNVTVIANKDEIGKPESIKPAIRVVDTHTGPGNNHDDEQRDDEHHAQEPLKGEPPVLTTSDQLADTGPFDDTEAWPMEDHAVQHEQRPADRQHHEHQHHEHRQKDYGQHGHTAIPATSRPGGDAPTPRRLKDKLAPYGNETKTSPKPGWFSWIAVVPLIILFMLVAFYFAYKAGFSAGSL